MAVEHHVETLAYLYRAHVPPTEGERRVVEWLADNLDASYHIAFQPYLNMLRPDVVVFHRQKGLLVIEVKDWDLTLYEIYEGKWRLRKEGKEVESPITQVTRYKAQMYELFLPTLLQSKLLNVKAWGAVKCAVIFTRMNESAVTEFIRPLRGTESRKTDADYTLWLGNDSLTHNGLNQLLKEARLSKSSATNPFFNTKVVHEIETMLGLTEEQSVEGQNRKSTRSQSAFLKRNYPASVSISGLAGSGKTAAMVARCGRLFSSNDANTPRRILYTYFNKTLAGLILDEFGRQRLKVNRLRVEGKLMVVHYHQLIYSTKQATKPVLERDDEDEAQAQAHEIWATDSQSGQCNLKDAIREHGQFDAVYIDEAQDFSTDWIQKLKTTYLKPGGEFVIGYDHKQRIYAHAEQYSDKSLASVTFTTPFRMNRELTQLALQYRATFMPHLVADVLEASETQRRMTYDAFAIQKVTTLLQGYTAICEFLEQTGAHINDVVILAEHVQVLRNVDTLYRLHTGRDATRSFVEDSLLRGHLLNSTVPLPSVLLKIAGDPAPKNQQSFKSKPAAVNLSEDQVEQVGFVWSALQFEQELKQQPNDIRHTEMLIRMQDQINRIWPSGQADAVQFLRNKQLDTTNQDRIMRSMPIKNLENSRKRNFRGNAGTIKMSTVHSFKGWGASTVVMIVTTADEGHANKPESHGLMYTAITRARHNFLLIDLGAPTLASRVQTCIDSIR